MYVYIDLHQGMLFPNKKWKILNTEIVHSNSSPGPNILQLEIDVKDNKTASVLTPEVYIYTHFY